ncbi:hypothetical protein C8J56DRAFT_924539 [Mycena floridula]|nr:hypothetical protein C8J56DRAFT_924539 [Mycena floridula]
MLENHARIIVIHSVTREFLDTIEALLTSPETRPVLRERLMKILSAISYEIRNDTQYGVKFRELWLKVKPAQEADEGAPCDIDDVIFRRHGRSARHSGQEAGVLPESAAQDLHMGRRLSEASSNTDYLSVMSFFSLKSSLRSSHTDYLSTRSFFSLGSSLDTHLDEVPETANS